MAKEVVRVTRPGGRIVMGNWIANDPTFVAQLLRITAAYSPPPPAGFISPVTWGVEDNVTERFAAAGIPSDRILCQRGPYMFNFPGTTAEFISEFKSYSGPTMNAFDAAAATGRERDLQRELEALASKQNTSGSRTATSIPATYPRVTVSV